MRATAWVAAAMFQRRAAHHAERVRRPRALGRPLMRTACLLVVALSAACSAGGDAPAPDVTRTPAATPLAVSPVPVPSLDAPAAPVAGAQPPAASEPRGQPNPQGSPARAAPVATPPGGSDASQDPNGSLEVPLLTPAWGKPLPPPPAAYEAEAEARAAPHQACKRDRDCTVAVEGCCDEHGYARGIGVARKQLEAYRREFRCQREKCATRAGDMLCGDGPTPRCETVPVPKARCVEERCSFHGHY
jgi:hypothetical protein